MSNHPEKILVRNHTAAIRRMDYIAVDGVIYAIRANAFNGNIYLEKVEEIPEDYHD